MRATGVLLAGAAVTIDVDDATPTTIHPPDTTFRPSQPVDPGMVLSGHHVYTAEEITRGVGQGTP